MLSNKTIEAVKRVVNVKDIIEKYTKIKKSGRRYVCCCPFHHEKTPSFFISEDNNFYKCFGCGEYGDAISFVRKMENVNFIEAIEIIAKEYNIPIEEDESFNNTEEELLYKEKKEIRIILEEVVKFYKNNINEEYLNVSNYLKNRNIDKDTIENFKIGYDNGLLYKYLKENNLNIELAKKIGIINFNNEDVFKNRLIIPIFDSRNNILGFGGRIIEKQDNIAKYINSCDNVLFHKNENLFNINLAKETILLEKKAYLVEGYFDAITLYKNGIKNVVASCGTAFTNNQCKLLKRFTNQITIFYDNDQAGQKATLLAIEKILPYDIMVNIVKIDKYKDPDELTNNIDIDKLKQYIDENEYDFVTYLINIFNYNVEKDINKRNIVLNEINRLISLIKDDIYKNLLLNKLEKLTNIKISNKQSIVYKKNVDIKKDNNICNIDIIEGYEYEILKIIINLIKDEVLNIDIVNFLKSELNDIQFKNNNIEKYINTIILLFEKNANLSIKDITENITDDLKEFTIDLIFDDKISKNWIKTDLYNNIYKVNNVFENIKKTILRLKLSIVKELIKNLNSKISNNLSTDEIYENLNILKKKEISLCNDLGIVIL